MKIKNYIGVCFSPTGTTAKVTDAILSGIGEGNITDITARPVPITAGREDCVIVGVPVFGGRIPPVAALHLSQLRGDRTPAAVVAVYGNRAYEDALLELKDVLEEQGFVVIAAAAFVAQHSIVPKIAQGRPNREDIAAAKVFGTQIAARCASVTDTVYIDSLVVPGNRPYREYKAVPFHPSAGKSCTSCGLCAKECPVSAIPESDPEKTDDDRCVSCMHCVSVCPNKARQLSAIHRKMAELALAKACKEEKQPEIFI